MPAATGNPDRAPRLSVVTVQYGNFSDTAELASSLEKLGASHDIELTVVDNASDADSSASLDALAARMPFRMRRLDPGGNVYYWGGADFALRSLDHSGAAWVMICNNDITVDPSFAAQLGELDASQLGIVAPSITSSVTGREQNPLLEQPPGWKQRLKWRIYDLHFLVASAMLSVHSALSAPPTAAGPRERRMIYAPHGACVLLSRAFFDAGGSLDTTVPLFAEELTLARDARALQMPIVFEPSLRVTHREHSTTGAKLTREKFEMQRMARRHYYSIARDD